MVRTVVVARRLRLQGQTIDAPDLTRVYKLTLGPGASVVAEFAADPNVEYGLGSDEAVGGVRRYFAYSQSEVSR
jgi:hypothetical protein